MFRDVACEGQMTGKRCGMEMEGVVHNGVIIPDDVTAFPEGTRVRIEPMTPARQATFGELFGDLPIDCPDLPTDLAAQHEHYRLGKPKR